MIFSGCWLKLPAISDLFPFGYANLLQEPVSAAFSALNLLMHFIGWLSFFILVHYKLPLRPQSKRTYYEYTGLWHIYGLLSMNAWFWSAIFHTLWVLLPLYAPYWSFDCILHGNQYHLFSFVFPFLQRFQFDGEVGLLISGGSFRILSNFIHTESLQCEGWGI